MMRALVLLLLAGLGALSAQAQQVKRLPNILLILADDLGYGDLSCCNAKSLIPTPHLDALAAAGTRFTEAHAPASVCSPTRYGLLTGRYPWRTAMKEGVLYDFCPSLIKPGRITLASLLKQAGYHTAGFGKWHLGLDWTPKEGDPGDWQWGQSVRYDAARIAERVDFTKPVQNGPTQLGFDTFYAGISQGVSRRYLQDDRVTADVIEKTQMDNVFTASAASFLRDHVASQSDKPFFLYLPLGAAHVPLTPPPDLAGKSRTGKLGDMVLWVDQSVGKMTTLLEELGLAKDTLVLFTSDNGAIKDAQSLKLGHDSSAGRRGFKTDVWDGGTHVPFIVRWPGRVPAGRTSSALLCLTDVFATVAAIAGQALPRWQAEDSQNMLPLWLGQTEEGRKELITQSYTGVLALRDAEWKLILGTRGGGGHQGITGEWQANASGFDRPSSTTVGQLYRVVVDPGEVTGQWMKNEEVVTRMKQRLDLLIRQGFSREEGW